MTRQGAREQRTSREPSGLPDIDRLLEVSRALAVLDATLCPEWEFRYFSFNDVWNDSPDEKLLFMRNGEGDHFQVYFAPAGALIKGFAHDAPSATDGRTPPDLFVDMPRDLEALLDDEVLSRDDTTFCLWRGRDDGGWRRGGVSDASFAAPGRGTDGSERLLAFLDGEPSTYARWASEYYGRPIDVEAVREVFAQRPLSGSLARRLDPRAELAELAAEVEGIGYPVLRSPFG